MSGVSPVLRRIFLVAPSGGKTDDARDFMRELEGNRKADYRRSERRIGTTKEVWYLARTPAGDQFVADMEIEDFGRALSLFSGDVADVDGAHEPTVLVQRLGQGALPTAGVRPGDEQAGGGVPWCSSPMARTGR
jgi:hypothetical protein